MPILNVSSPFVIAASYVTAFVHYEHICLFSLLSRFEKVSVERNEQNISVIRGQLICNEAFSSDELRIFHLLRTEKKSDLKKSSIRNHSKEINFYFTFDVQHCKPNPPLPSLSVDVGHFPTLTSSRTSRRNCSRDKVEANVTRMLWKWIFIERDNLFEWWCGLFSPLVLSQAIMNRRTESEGEGGKKKKLLPCLHNRFKFPYNRKMWPRKIPCINNLWPLCCFFFVLGNAYLAT